MFDSLCDAIENGDRQRFEELLKDKEALGEIINHRPHSWAYTPLMLAADYCRLEFIQPLIDNGADVNKCSSDGYEAATALYRACEEEDLNGIRHDEAKRLEVVKLLVKNGAKLDIGDSPLNIAVENGYKEIVKFFVLEHKADVNAIDDGGDYNHNASFETPLSQACSKCDWEIVKFLVENGARPDLGHSSPLIIASIRGHIATVRLLLEVGAEVNKLKIDKDYGTALHGACCSAYRLDEYDFQFKLIDKADTVALLLEHGADPYLSNYRGKIAADVVEKEEFPEILQLFRIHDYFARKEQGDDFKEEYESRHIYTRETKIRKKPPAAQLKDIIHVMVKHPQYVEKFQTIFQENPDVIYWTDSNERSVMHVACKAYHPVIMKGLSETSLLLDLLLWKLKIEETSTTSTGIDRTKCRVSCGSNIVIPKVLEFLGIELLSLKQENKKARTK